MKRVVREDSLFGCGGEHRGEHALGVHDDGLRLRLREG